MFKKTMVRSATSAALCCSLLMGAPASAQGLYDGIWIAPSPGFEGVFVQLWEKSGTLLALLLELDPTASPQLAGGEWEAYAGPLTADTANMSTIVSRADANATVTFTSPDSGTVTINFCTPPEECPIPINQPFPIERFF
jgi:hypothetical protein